jgi:aspartyl-tRNA(Asn)/glutamyl-tRNA(Gln) amidotransferase subunit C
MEVSAELIEKLARLSRLSFANQIEKDKIQKDLTSILGFVEQLNEVNTDNVEPLIFINEDANTLRPDVVHQEISQTQALINAPHKNDDYFMVPKVIAKK